MCLKYWNYRIVDINMPNISLLQWLMGELETVYTNGKPLTAHAKFQIEF
jgi:hypothetical protein